MVSLVSDGNGNIYRRDGSLVEAPGECCCNPPTSSSASDTTSGGSGSSSGTSNSFTGPSDSGTSGPGCCGGSYQGIFPPPGTVVDPNDPCGWINPNTPEYAACIACLACSAAATTQEECDLCAPPCSATIWLCP